MRTQRLGIQIWLYRIWLSLSNIILVVDKKVCEESEDKSGHLRKWLSGA